jgi:His/Glu/Gln/Arg/opine family amino acid ABC transporter permease subunit
MNTNNDGFFWQLGSGMLVTIELAVCALFLGLLLGLIGAWGENARLRPLRWITTLLISCIRGLPELLVIFLVYFGGTVLLTAIAGHYVNFSSFFAGVLALSLLFGSYASQVFRGAFLAVPRGQTEAGRALGLSRPQIFFYIQLPQAWHHALPGLGNLWLVLLKDTALISLIGVTDLMNKAQTASSTTHKPFTFYLAAALLYLIMTSISETLIKKTNQLLTKQTPCKTQYFV